jgi:acetylornithine deacetylase/succinyl-diaminopimelate desuccinylase-like protein
MTDDVRHEMRDVLRSVRPDLEALVRIPSVSADPARAADLRQAAEMTARLFREAGARATEVADGAGGARPAVLAWFPAPPGMPTVLLYAHYDVQPTGDPAMWATPPFEPTERGGRLYGRGTADDKAGVAAHLAALRFFRGRPPVGVTVVVEGEEEIGSPGLGAFLRDYRDRLAADVIVLADSVNFTAGAPSLTNTLRGMVDCVVEVRTLDHSVHSGNFGGAAPDALTALCRLLATLHDDTGEIAVQGMHTSAAPDFEYPEERFRADASLLPGVHLVGVGGLAERLWAKPTISVLAIDAPSVAQASNTLVATARAKISMRIAPGDDSAAALDRLIEHLRKHAPWGAQVEVTAGKIGRPCVIDADGPAFDAARAAFGAAYGEPVRTLGLGGTIPFIAEFAEAFPGAAILVTSAGCESGARIHGVDEGLLLADFESACVGEALLLIELAQQNGKS